MKFILKNFLLLLTFFVTYLASITWITLAAENVTSNTTEGTVLRTTDNTLTIQTDEGIKDYSIPENIKITKNQFDSDLNNINPNDRIIITTGNNGEILAVDAVSSQIANIENMALPILALLLIGIGLLLTFLQKKQKGIIKTKIKNL